MQPNFTANKRIVWIDWMKSIGIYFIVLGHFFSIGDIYVYVFSVPLFFIISGFLCKPEKDTSVFLRKTWYNLIVPMLIISLLVFAYSSLLQARHGTFEPLSIAKFVMYVLAGMHNGVHECWFVYTLVITKVIYQYCHSGKANILLPLLFLLGAYVYNRHSLPWMSNSYLNVCTAYPFFILGTYLRTYRNSLDCITNKLHLGIIFAISLSIVYICGKYNGYVYMYICGYGGDIFIFLTGGIAGSIAVFAVSKLFHTCPAFIMTISKGTIIILGFHIRIIPFIRRVAPDTTLWDYAFAALIVIAFVPLIIISEKYFPLILGKYRASVSKHGSGKTAITNCHIFY